MDRGMVFTVEASTYDRFMGRYSTRLAPLFADFAGLGPQARVLDVGAGAGALAAELVARLGAENVAAAEPSEQFAATLHERLTGVDVRRAPAEELPWEDASFDAALAQLVIAFVADAAAAVAEMGRVVRPGGLVAACTWDEGGLELQVPLRAARLAAAPDAPPLMQLPFRSREALGGLLAASGLRDVETAILEVSTEYTGFDEFWEVAAAMTGPDTLWMQGLDEEQLARGREAARDALGSPAGAFTLRARAAAARAVRE